jgi:hypothetical protein
MIEADDSFLSEEKKEWYRIDAKKLSLKYLNDADPDRIDIPVELVDLFYHGLIHIYNSDLEQARLVTRESPVHATQPHSPYEIMVSVDTDAASGWLNNWRNEQTETGELKIDELIETFDYILIRYSELTSSPRSIAILRSVRLLNDFATGRRFEQHAAVEHAGPVHVLYAGFRRDIEAEVLADHIFYEFIGIKDTSTLIRYKFKVFGDGWVEFVED